MPRYGGRGTRDPDHADPRGPGRLTAIGEIVQAVTAHPAYLLRNPHEKKTVWKDMKLLQREYETLTKAQHLTSAPEPS